MNAEPQPEALRPVVTTSTPLAVAPVHATRGQRIALLVGLLVVLWLGLQLFASILLPFVAAAGIAYVLDPFCSRMTRARLPRGVAALLLVIGLIAAGLVFVLLLYPLILSQIGILVGRVPDYVRGVSAFAAKSIAQLQQHLGPEYVDAKLSELVSSQAGAMLNFLVTAATRIVGGGFAVFICCGTGRAWWHAWIRGCRAATRPWCGRRRGRWTAFWQPGCVGRHYAA
jgi:predicted PurR-regulated permease PerM